ncbi:MAG: isoprenylcysteine carboxylmethyltransferase family protein [Deltaproteobacteria bacterium]|nr:isoprenylcysteine carboxylmethyltransferase family protein [Deltaproteobacteria bacterium]
MVIILRMLVFRTIVIGTILLFIALVAGPYFAVQFDFIAKPLPLGFFRYFGVVLMVFGAPLAAGSTYLLLVPGKDRPVPYDSPEGLSVAGPYKYIRNPFMLGWILVLWGEVVFFRSVPLLIYAVILTLSVHFWVFAYEEPTLENRYGEEYRRYKASTPRWIPNWRRGLSSPAK